MTDGFKQTLFDYLIGKLDIQQGTNEEIFKEIKVIPSSDFRENIPDYKQIRFEGLLQIKNSQFFCIYGGYIDFDTDENRGIIIVLDSNFKEVVTYTKYNDENYLDYIMCMIQEDDGTFTATTCKDFPRNENWSFTSSTKKFVMFNNFTQQINNNYTLIMNKSYDIPYKNNYIRKMFKDPNSSHYVLLCSVLTDQDSQDYDKTRIIEVKINVGSENEWAYTDTEDNWILGNSYVEFDSNSNSFVELLLSTNLRSRGNVVATWTKGFNDTSYTYKTIHTFSFKPYVDSYTMSDQSVFLNKNELYFIQNNQHWGTPGKSEAKYLGLYYYNIQTEEFKTIYEKYLGDYDYSDIEEMFISQLNNNLYIEFVEVINSSSTGGTGKFYVQRFEGAWNPIYIKDDLFSYFYNNFFISSQFNLLNLIIWANSNYWFGLKLKENYSESKYNSQPYINTNAMIADNAEIYSNGNLVFARDLYNKSLNGNTTVATVEVPNNYLNDADITNKNLLSETNLTMISDTNMTQKNIYETLYINFINTLLIVDRNNATQVLNQQASTYLNAQINDDEGYSKAQIYPKVVITYQDNSTKEIAFEYQNIEDTSADIVFALYVDQLMQSAEIISNDKSIVYQTINLTNLEQDKYYVIRQNLKII